MIFEDDLPNDFSDESYDKWYDESYVLGGVGCRVGPDLPGEEITDDVVRRMRAEKDMSHEHHR